MQQFQMHLKMQIFDYSIQHDNYTVITKLKDYYAFITELKIKAIIVSRANTNYICKRMLLLSTESKFFMPVVRRCCFDLNNYHFQPLGIETTGVYGESSLLF